MRINSNGIIKNPTDLIQGSVQDQIEDRSAYLRSDDAITWTGTQLEFSSDIVLELINTASGAVKAFTIASAQSPITLNNNESAYIAISDRGTSAAATIVKSDSVAIPSHSNADKNVFVLFRRKDTAGAVNVLHIPLHKQALDPGQSVRLGASGAGGGGGGLDIFKSQDFESLSVADFSSDQDGVYKTVNAGFDGVLSDETSTPIAGKQSPKYTAGASSTNDWFDVETIVLDDKQRDTDIGITFYADTSGFTVDVEFVVWDNFNNKKLDISGLNIIKASTSLTRYPFSVRTASNTASISYGFHMVNAPVNGESFKFDDVEFSTNPFVVKNLTDRQYDLFDVHAGFSSNNLNVPFYTNQRDTEAGDLYTITNDSSDGFFITVNRTCNMSIILSVSEAINRNLIFGIIKNPTVGELDTDPDSITAEEKFLAYNYIEGSTGDINLDTVSFNGRVEAGDVIYPLTRVSTPVDGDNNRIVISATAESEHIITPAKAGTEHVFYEGFTSRNGSAFVLMKTEKQDTSSNLLVVTNTDHTRFTALGETSIVVTASGARVAAGTNIRVQVFNSSDVLQVRNEDTAPTANNFGNSSLTYKLQIGDYVVFFAGDNLLDDTRTTFSIKAQPIEATFLAAIPVTKIAFVRDRKTSGVTAGASSVNTVHIRDLNELTGDTGFISINGTTSFTLESGKYNIKATIPAFNIDSQGFLFNTTTSNYDIEGQNLQILDGADTGGFVHVEGVITLSVTSTFEIRHWSRDARVDGLGKSGDGTNNPQTQETYTTVKITKLR